MRIFLSVLILILSVQSLTKADDISNFEIEGISIGDSVLDFFTKKEIKKNTWDYFKNKEFTPLQFDNPKFAKTYDAIDIQYKTSDKNFTVMGLSGIIFYTDKKKINDCYKKMELIANEIRSLFSNVDEQSVKNSIHRGVDDGGKSTFSGVYFQFDNQDIISVQCYNYSVESGDQNHLRIGINSKEYINFIRDKAYK